MKPLLLTIALLFSTPAWAETILYCQSELATGLVKENGRWKEMGFEPIRLTVKFNDDYSVISGLALGDFYCQKTFPDSPMIVCNVHRLGMSLGVTFNYNPTNKRFIYGYVGVNGYIENAVRADTESIHAGTCQQF